MEKFLGKGRDERTMSQVIFPTSQQPWRTLPYPSQGWPLRREDIRMSTSLPNVNEDQPLDFSKKATFPVANNFHHHQPRPTHNTSFPTVSYEQTIRNATKTSSPLTHRPTPPIKIPSPKIDVMDEVPRHRAPHLTVDIPAPKSGSAQYHSKTPSPASIKDPNSDEFSSPGLPMTMKPGMLSASSALNYYSPNPGITNQRMFPTREELMKLSAGLFQTGDGILRTALQPMVPSPVEQDPKGAKHTRPFKAYNPLSSPFPTGVPVLPMGVVQDFEDQEYRYQQFLQHFYVTRSVDAKANQDDSATPQEIEISNVSSRQSPSTSGRPDSSPPVEQQQKQLQMLLMQQQSPGQETGQLRQVADTSTATQDNRNAKRGRALPEEVKDAAYWERRKKNNEAAKRSRDSRRQKEDYIAMRAKFLEDENKNLRLTIAFLRQELSVIKCCAAHNHSRL